MLVECGDEDLGKTWRAHRPARTTTPTRSSRHTALAVHLDPDSTRWHLSVGSDGDVGRVSPPSETEPRTTRRRRSSRPAPAGVRRGEVRMTPTTTRRRGRRRASAGVAAAAAEKAGPASSGRPQPPHYLAAPPPRVLGGARPRGPRRATRACAGTIALGRASAARAPRGKGRALNRRRQPRL